MRQNLAVRYRNTPPIYIDMSLYQEIIFLQYNCSDKLWVVENVRPYYKPLILPTAEVQRHLFWSNKNIVSKEFKTEKLRKAQIPQLQELHGIDLTGIKLPNKRQCLRNCVLPEVGLYVFEEVTK